MVLDGWRDGGMIWGDRVYRERKGRGGGFYIEDSDCILSPWNADLTVLRVDNVLEEKTEQCVAFLFLEPDNVRSICVW